MTSIQNIVINLEEENENLKKKYEDLLERINKIKEGESY